MQLKRILAISMLLLFGQNAVANTLKIYVSDKVTQCVSFNLIKIDQPVQFKEIIVCPGKVSYFNSLSDGMFNLFATEIAGQNIVMPYGENEYLNNPIALANESDLAIYYPSSFFAVNG